MTIEVGGGFVIVTDADIGTESLKLLLCQAPKPSEIRRLTVDPTSGTVFIDVFHLPLVQSRELRAVGGIRVEGKKLAALSRLWALQGVIRPNGRVMGKRVDSGNVATVVIAAR